MFYGISTGDCQLKLWLSSFFPEKWRNRIFGDTSKTSIYLKFQDNYRAREIFWKFKYRVNTFLDNK